MHFVLSLIQEEFRLFNRTSGKSKANSKTNQLEIISNIYFSGNETAERVSQKTLG
jgi:hypothetical protein